MPTDIILNFTRRYIYGKGNKLMRADYYCNIEGFKLKGTCELYSNMVLKIWNNVNEIKHSKGKLKSFQSEYIRTPLREKISEQLQETNTPGKEWLRNSKHIPSEQFDAGNLGNSVQSKQVFRQLRHEGKLKKHLDKDPIQSIRKLISKFQDDYPDKVVPGYMRHFSMEPLVIDIWFRVDVEEFHKKVANLPCIQDATASIATAQKMGREIHYYAYTLYNQSVKIEPVPFLEILTDCLDERPLNICLDGFKKDDEVLYGHNNLSPHTCCV